MPHATLAEYMTSKLLKVASKFGSLQVKHLLPLQADCKDPSLSWIYSPASEPFPCPTKLTLEFINQIVGWQQQVHTHSPFSTSLVTLLLWGLLLSCHQIIACWEEGMSEASVVFPQSSDSWNTDRSICHFIPSNTNLMSAGLTYCNGARVAPILACSSHKPLENRPYVHLP